MSPMDDHIELHARVDWAFGLLWASLGLPSSQALRGEGSDPLYCLRNSMAVHEL